MLGVLVLSENITALMLVGIALALGWRGDGTSPPLPAANISCDNFLYGFKGARRRQVSRPAPAGLRYLPSPAPMAAPAKDRAGPSSVPGILSPRKISAPIGRTG